MLVCRGLGQPQCVEVDLILERIEDKPDCRLGYLSLHCSRPQRLCIRRGFRSVMAYWRGHGLSARWGPNRRRRASPTSSGWPTSTAVLVAPLDRTISLHSSCVGPDWSHHTGVVSARMYNVNRSDIDVSRLRIFCPPTSSSAHYGSDWSHNVNVVTIR